MDKHERMIKEHFSNSHTIQQAMKPDERIVCTNATVVMDGRGELSYFDNEGGICLIEEEGRVLPFVRRGNDGEK